jgi:hypothetical protein
MTTREREKDETFDFFSIKNFFELTDYLSDFEWKIFSRTKSKKTSVKLCLLSYSTCLSRERERLNEVSHTSIN